MLIVPFIKRNNYEYEKRIALIADAKYINTVTNKRRLNFKNFRSSWFRANGSLNNVYDVF